MRRKRFFATLKFARTMRSQGHTLRRLLLTIFMYAWTDAILSCLDDTEIADKMRDFWINLADHAE